LISTLKVISI